jgi:hypothetical protein
MEMSIQFSSSAFMHILEVLVYEQYFAQIFALKTKEDFCPENMLFSNVVYLRCAYTIKTALEPTTKCTSYS